LVVKKDLDLTSTEYFGIRTFLKPENAKTKYGKKQHKIGRYLQHVPIPDDDSKVLQ
jgi:hypothetical protein